MKILIAPDSFKGSLSATQFCQIATEAILALYPDAQIHSLPLADGGEGTVDTFLDLPGYEAIQLTVNNALGQPIKAYYAYQKSSSTAVIEMAAASGLPHIPIEQRNALRASSFGTGQLLLDAKRRGAKQIVLGLGGSATTDAGIGMLACLGFQFLDAAGQSISLNGAGLIQLHKIVVPEDDWSEMSLRVACDIHNPLHGKQGAAYIFAPQKGASPDEVTQLDTGLRQFAKVVERDLTLQVADVPGAGAAGGMGAGVQLLGGQLDSGFQIIADALQLEALLVREKFDLVVTGEGQFNHQSQYGKVPVELAKRAKQQGATVVALVGAIDESNEHIYQHPIDAIFALVNQPMSLDKAMEMAPELLFNQVQNVVRLFKCR